MPRDSIWKRNQLKKRYSLQDMISEALSSNLNVGSQYENVGKRITRLKITDQVI